MSRIVDLQEADPTHVNRIADMIAATYAYAGSHGEYYRNREDQLRFLMANPHVLELYDLVETSESRYDNLAPDTVLPHQISETPLAIQQLGNPTLVRGKPYIRLASIGVHPQIVGTLNHGRAVLDLQLEVLRHLGEEFNMLSIFPANRRAEIRHFGQAGYQPVLDIYLADQILQFHGSIGHALTETEEGVLVSRMGKQQDDVLLVRPAGPLMDME